MNLLFDYLNKKQFLVFLKDKNSFYANLYRNINVEKICSIKDFQDKIPFIDKDTIANDQIANPPFGSNHSKKIEAYHRFHQTSGTTSEPIKWLDTKESWSWIVDSWKTVLLKAEISDYDVGAFAFSFGPFLGFWGAFESAVELGLLCIPLGGMTSESRLEAICKNKVSVLFCTPTYAQHLGKLKEKNKLQTYVKKIIVAGEPGGSQKAIRNMLSLLWDGAEIYDHHGMTEVGPVSYSLQTNDQFHLGIISGKYHAEVIDPVSKKLLGLGDEGELVLTTLGRLDCPLVRYKTGDLVRLQKMIGPEGDEVLYLENGINGRVDQMVVIRGVNIYPSAISSILSKVKGVAEHETRIYRDNEMDELELLIELEDGLDQQITQKAILDSFYKSLQIRINVTFVKRNTLPRYEMKAKRWRDERK